jgi:hypothetical protein
MQTPEHTEGLSKKAKFVLAATAPTVLAGCVGVASITEVNSVDATFSTAADRAMSQWDKVYFPESPEYPQGVTMERQGHASYVSDEKGETTKLNLLKNGKLDTNIEMAIATQNMSLSNGTKDVLHFLVSVDSKTKQSSALVMIKDDKLSTSDTTVVHLATEANGTFTWLNKRLVMKTDSTGGNKFIIETTDANGNVISQDGFLVKADVPNPSPTEVPPSMVDELMSIGAGRVEAKAPDPTQAPTVEPSKPPTAMPVVETPTNVPGPMAEFMPNYAGDGFVDKANIEFDGVNIQSFIHTEKSITDIVEPWNNRHLKFGFHHYFAQIGPNDHVSKREKNPPIPAEQAFTEGYLKGMYLTWKANDPIKHKQTFEQYMELVKAHDPTGFVKIRAWVNGQDQTVMFDPTKEVHVVYTDKHMDIMTQYIFNESTDNSSYGVGIDSDGNIYFFINDVNLPNIQSRLFSSAVMTGHFVRSLSRLSWPSQFTTPGDKIPPPNPKNTGGINVWADESNKELSDILVPSDKQLANIGVIYIVP